MRFALPHAPVVLLLLASCDASAGPHLRWDACFGEHGAKLDNPFACSTNTGAEALVLSFLPPDSLQSVVAFEAMIDLESDAAALPDWWALDQCRPMASRMDRTMDPSWSVCTDFFRGASYAVIVGGLDPVHPARNRIEWRIVAAIPDPGPDPGVVGVPIGPDSGELFLCRLVIRNTRTIGANACAGCSIPACIVVRTVNIVRPSGVGDFQYSGMSSRDGQTYVTWHNGSSPPCPVLTAIPNRTWGEVVAQYR